MNPIRLQFLEGVSQTDGPAADAFQFSLKREREAVTLQREHAFDCFSYTLQGKAVPGF